MAEVQRSQLVEMERILKVSSVDEEVSVSEMEEKRQIGKRG